MELKESKIVLKEDWEYNVLGVYNYNKKGPLRHYYQFIREHIDHIEGDILEAGVFRGNSLIATGMLLKELGSNKKVYGFDTFSGFPSSEDKHDSLDEFDSMYSDGLITKAHLDKVRRNAQIRSLNPTIANKLNTGTISSSGDFSETSVDLVRDKINYLGLDNIELISGDFERSMNEDDFRSLKLMAALVDCDLYAGYKSCLPFIWDKLSIGGYIYLDEYYSLKFPGARRASLEFYSSQKDKPQMHTQEPGDFERWYVRKIHA